MYDMIQESVGQSVLAYSGHAFSSSDTIKSEVMSTRNDLAN